jgi:two-component system CheB/CheR fusion protein
MFPMSASIEDWTMDETFRLPCRVLVIDDCRDTIDSLAMLLQCWGHDVRTAQDGTAALEIARTFAPDVVLLDLAMPGMDGFEVARRLRGELRLNDALVLALSGFGRDEDRVHALEAGCDRHLLKPVSPDFLKQVLAARHAFGGGQVQRT